MRLKLYFAVAVFLVASGSQADDNFTNLVQNRRDSTKPVSSASQHLKQKQTAGFAGDLSTTAIGAGNVKLVRDSRVVPGQQQVVDSPTPVQSQSFFGRILELERRKNAWLRRIFLGRE